MSVTPLGTTSGMFITPSSAQTLVFGGFDGALHAQVNQHQVEITCRRCLLQGISAIAALQNFAGFGQLPEQGGQAFAEYGVVIDDKKFHPRTLTNRGAQRMTPFTPRNSESPPARRCAGAGRSCGNAGGACAAGS
jgi:hypothetical protein